MNIQSSRARPNGEAAGLPESGRHVDLRGAVREIDLRDDGRQPARRGPQAPLRIAMIGQRGVPATYGGVEHHVEELGARLAERGHEVTVFCRTNYVKERQGLYRGMRLNHLPTLNTKHFDAIAHSGLSTLRALGGGYDVVHYHSLGPGLFAFLPRLFSKSKVVQTIHGLDQERAKWGGVARSVLQTACWMSARVPHATITVSKALAEHYGRHHGRATDYIPNGVTRPEEMPETDLLAPLGLQPEKYLLFVGRLVPEKLPDLLVRAFREVPGDVRLVLAGGGSFTNDYVESLGRLAESDSRVVLAGYVYGKTLQCLYANAAAFVLPSSLEGLPLTLLEAASHGTPVVVSDIPAHLEIITKAGPGRHIVPCDDLGSLVTALKTVLENRAEERRGAAHLKEEVLSGYKWENVASATENVYRRVLNGTRGIETSPRPARVLRLASPSDAQAEKI